MIIVKTEVEVTRDMIENIIVGALEGGSNYWMDFKVHSKHGRFEWSSTEYAHQLLDDEYELEIFDIEDGTRLGILSKETLTKAIENLGNTPDSRRILTQIVEENDDANTHDYVVQMAVMGEITYG